jgi:hypothetical protein
MEKLTSKMFVLSAGAIVCAAFSGLFEIAPAFAQTRYIRRAIINQTITGNKFTASF